MVSQPRRPAVAVLALEGLEYALTLLGGDAGTLVDDAS